MKFRRLENGFGNISKLSGNRRKPFRARKTIGYNENGNQLYETIGYYKTYTDAFEALVEYNKNPYDLSQKDLTLGEFTDNWFKIQEQKVAHNTVRTYKTSINKIRHLYPMKFDDINTATIQQVVDGIESHSAKRHVKLLFTQLYKFARERDIFKKDYAEFVFLKNDEKEKTEKIPFTDDEIKICYDNRNDSKYAMILILLCTGFRPIELINLKKENINLDEKYILGGAKTKTGKNRRVPISRHIEPILRELVERDSPHLFLNAVGTKMGYHTFLNNFKALFPDHSPHECRHTFVSNLDRVNCNIRVIKKIVGHSSTDVTEQVYTHKTAQELQEAMCMFDEYLHDIVCI